MGFEISFIQLMPLRAVFFQLLFLLIAIAIETIVLRRHLTLDHKTCVQYAATMNLLSTFLGWVIFFNVLPILPSELKTQLLSFIFFEQFFDNGWLEGVAPILVVLCLGIFLGTFVVKLKSLQLLELLLGKIKLEKQPEEKFSRLRRQINQVVNSQKESTTYAIFVANSFSFSAILFLLFVRFVEQSYPNY